MWFLQRDDVSKRNQWSNYSNWPYKNPPNPPIPAGKQNASPFKFFGSDCNYPPDTLYNSGFYSPIYDKQILLTWSLLLDGAYRETEQPTGVVDYIEKYKGTSGFAHPGLYCYNFCLHTNPFDFQPSGAMNMSKFSTIQFEFVTHIPPIDASAQVLQICDPETGIPIGVNKSVWRLFDYNYNMILLEERYNVITFVGGNCALMYAR